MPFALNFRERLPGIVREELDQLMAALQDLEGQIGTARTASIAVPSVTTEWVYLDTTIPSAAKGAMGIGPGGSINLCFNCHLNATRDGWESYDSTKNCWLFQITSSATTLYYSLPVAGAIAFKPITSQTPAQQSLWDAASVVKNYWKNVGGGLYLSQNLSHDGVNWNADDTAAPGTLLIESGGSLFSYASTPGANPRPLAETMRVTTLGIRERGRTTPMGDWTNVPYAAGNYSAATGTWTVVPANAPAHMYTLVGKTLYYNITLVNTVVSAATGALYIMMPSGILPACTMYAPWQYYNGSWVTGLVATGTGVGYLTLYPPSGTVGPSNPFNLGMQLVIPTL